jgi:hypothetical protein
MGAGQHNLALVYASRTVGEKADNMEKAIAAYEAALTVRTREALPHEWAQTQNNLGLIYLDRIRDDRSDNLEKAIGCLGAALTVRTYEALPHEWADTQHNLGIAFKDRIRGDRSANLETAIAAARAALTVRTHEARPRPSSHCATSGAKPAGSTRRARAAWLCKLPHLLLLGEGINDAEARDLIAEAGYTFAQAAFAAAQRGDAEAALRLPAREGAI